MKKTLAIILCVVMLLPSFAFITSAEETMITTWDQYAAEHDDYQLTQIVATQNAPTVDGVISDGEYSKSTGSWIDLTKFETDVPAVDGSTFFGTAPTLNMYLNETDSRIYFAFEIAYDASFDLNGQDEDFRVCISPQADHNIPASYANTTPMQIFLEWKSDGSATESGAQSTHITNTVTGQSRDAENNKLYYEFSVLKSELERRFIGYGDMVGFTFGAWFYHYQENSVRYGYGWEMVADTTAKNTPVTKFNNAGGGWDDQWLYVKLADNDIDDVNTWEELAEYGMPFANVTPTAAAPSVDGTVNASEYTSKVHLTLNDTGDTRAAAAVAAGAFPAYVDTYITSNENNIYMAVVIPKTSGFDATDIRLVADFTDGSNIYRPYVKKATNGTSTVFRNYKIAAQATPTDQLEGVNFGTFNSTYNPFIEWSNNNGNDVYTVEFVISKAIIKQEHGLKGDITYMNFGIWLPSVTYNSTSYRLAYGVKDTVKNAAAAAAGITFYDAYAYDLDDCVYPVKFADANTYGGYNSLNLSKFGQLTFYANNPTTAENTIDAVLSNGEYAFDQSFRTMRSGGSKSQWGVALGNAILAPEYAMIYMDYDADYFYLAIRIKDTNLVPRYVTAGAKYNYTEEVDPDTGDTVKKSAAKVVDSKEAYDMYKVQIAFNNNGSIFEASKELEFQFYMTADIKNDANDDGVAQAEELTPSCHIKSLVGGSEKPLEGMKGAWDLDGASTKQFAGRWDSEAEELVFEVKVNKDKVVAAYGLDELNNTISFRMNHYPWQFGSNQSFEDVAGTATDIATGGGGGNGLKVYTSYWDGTTWLNTVNNYTAVLAELVGDSEEAYLKSGDFGHVVVLGTEMSVAPVSTANSASVRFNDGDTGMRFKSTVNKVYYDALVAEYGKDNVRFGTLITPKNYLEQATAFTKEALDLLPYSVDYLDVTTTKYYASTENTYTFLGSIANIKPANYDREFAAIGYIEYKDGEGITHTVYSDTYAVRSVAEVAEKILGDFTTDASLACGYTVANTEIIAGKTVYTPYTDAQRTIAKGFVA